MGRLPPVNAEERLASLYYGVDRSTLDFDRMDKERSDRP